MAPRKNAAAGAGVRRALKSGASDAGASARAAAADTEAAADTPPSAPAHTLQLVVLLWLQALLQIAAVLYLPQGVFSGGIAGVFNAYAPDADASRPRLTLYSGIYDMLNPPRAAPGTPPGRLAPAARPLFAALRALFLVQSFAVARLRWWWRIAARIERRESIKDLKRQQGMLKQAEGLVLTTLALPFPFAALCILLVLFGAPVADDYAATALLSAYLTLLALYAPVHVLGEDAAAWIRVFSRWPSAPRERILLLTTAGPLLGAWLAAAGLALDWGRPWQAWPVPCVLGALGGAVLGNVLAAIVYLFAPSAKT